MKYKGYTGVVELEEGSDVLFGYVIGLRDVITFEGESVAEVTQAFHDSVDFYLDFCAKRGESPEKPYSGQFVLRVGSRLHRELAHAAELRKTSLNGLIEGTLEGIFSTSAVAAKRVTGQEVPKDRRLDPVAEGVARIRVRAKKAASALAAKRALGAVTVLPVNVAPEAVASVLPGAPRGKKR